MDQKTNHEATDGQAPQLFQAQVAHQPPTTLRKPSSSVGGRKKRREAQQELNMPSKRPYSSFEADNDSEQQATSLVSSWLDSVYPPQTAKRRRCCSISAVDSKNADYQKDNEGSDDQKNNENNGDKPTRARSEPIRTPQDETFVRPLTPGSYQSWSRGQPLERGRTASQGGGSTRLNTVSPSPSRESLIEKDDYRRLNLEFNNSIAYCSPLEAFPERIQPLVDMITQTEAPSDPPAQLDAEVLMLELDYYRPMKAIVRKAFDNRLFIDPGASDNLQRADDQPMNRGVIPTNSANAPHGMVNEGTKDQHRISTPIPDILYGYPARAFSIPRQHQMTETLGTMESSNANFLRMPFLLVEFKGDRGSMWGCTNQCMGGAASCVNIGERLTRALASRDLTPFNSAVFSIAINNFDARLDVCWRHVPDDPELGASFQFRRVRSFYLGEADHYQLFKRCVQKIIDWGTGERFEQIENALDELRAKKRKMNNDSGTALAT